MVDATAWETVKDLNSVPVLEAFIRGFGNSFYANVARVRIEELRKRQGEGNLPAGLVAEPTATAAKAVAGVPRARLGCVSRWSPKISPTAPK